MTLDELIDLFQAKALAPPPAASQLFARHLECKESLQIASVLTSAMARHGASGDRPIPAPSEILPPLA